jgi:hypothetical protein
MYIRMYVLIIITVIVYDSIRVVIRIMIMILFIPFHIQDDDIMIYDSNNINSFISFFALSLYFNISLHCLCVVAVPIAKQSSLILRINFIHSGSGLSLLNKFNVNDNCPIGPPINILLIPFQFFVSTNDGIKSNEFNANCILSNKICEFAPLYNNLLGSVSL